MTAGEARRRLRERLAAALPPRRTGWNASRDRFTSMGALGPIIVEADAGLRIVRIFWRREVAGLVRPVRLAVGPMRGRRWPERLAEAAAAFLAGEPVEGVPHRELARAAELTGYAIRWTCPACGLEQLADLGDVVALTERAVPAPRRCAVCDRPAAVELGTTAAPVALRVVK